MSMTLKQAQAIITAILNIRSSADDKTASMCAAIYPVMRYDGSLISAGTRINWRGTIKKAAVNLWSWEDNDPDNAPELWEDLAYRDGIRIIPETLTVVSAFELDELGWWGDVLYRSKLPSNVYTPEQYPAGWEAVE